MSPRVCRCMPIARPLSPFSPRVKSFHQFLNPLAFSAACSRTGARASFTPLAINLGSNSVTPSHTFGLGANTSLIALSAFVSPDSTDSSGSFLNLLKKFLIAATNLSYRDIVPSFTVPSFSTRILDIILRRSGLLNTSATNSYTSILAYWLSSTPISSTCSYKLSNSFTALSLGFFFMYT